jgi:predicted PurR-regulated permease PerM
MASPNNQWQHAFYVPLTILAWLAVIIIAGWLITQVAHALLVIFLAVIIAFGITPLVRLLRHWFHRPIAVAITYLVVIAFVVSLGTLLVVTAASQVVNLVAALPTYLGEVKNFLPQIQSLLGPFGVTNTSLQDINQQIFGLLQQIGTTVATSSLSIISSVAALLLDAALILILSIYFSLDGPRAVGWLKEETPFPLRQYVLYFFNVFNQVVGGYIRGTIFMALLIGSLVGVGLGVIGLPYAVLLGVLAFFMAFVPVIGTFLSGAASLLIAFPHGIATTLIVLAYFVFVHIIEGDVLGPRILGRAVGIHPATGIIALLLGTEIFGVWGALFAAPLAGLLQAAVVTVWQISKGTPVEIVVQVATEGEVPPPPNQ